jgi:FkbM family methyltransferase
LQSFDFQLRDRSGISGMVFAFLASLKNTLNKNKSKKATRGYLKSLKSGVHVDTSGDFDVLRMLQARYHKRIDNGANSFNRSTACYRSRSQLQQDLFVLEQTDFKRGGFFVEVGVGTGEELSNTYLLETDFGWSGILCEPNPTVAASIRGCRSAALDTRAAYSISGKTVEFLCTDAPELSTMNDHLGKDAHSRQGHTVSVTTITLDELFTERGAPRDIDYISIDTEGSEVEVLKGLDLTRWNVKALTLEHNYDAARIADFDARLVPLGYRKVLAEISQFDAWYVKA